MSDIAGTRSASWRIESRTVGGVEYTWPVQHVLKFGWDWVDGKQTMVWRQQWARNPFLADLPEPDLQSASDIEHAFILINHWAELKIWKHRQLLNKQWAREDREFLRKENEDFKNMAGANNPFD